MVRKISQKRYLRKILHHLMVKYLKYNGVKRAKGNSALKVVLSDDYIGYNVILNGVYELDDLELFIDLLGEKYPDIEKLNLLDIGANIGNHTVFFANYFNKVISFEPNSEVFKVLKINTESIPNVKIHNFGLSDSVKSELFRYPVGNYGGGSVEQNGMKGNVSETTIALQKLDDLVSLRDISIDVIKIDVEGHEYQALSGGRDLILKNKPIVLFEQNIPEISNGSSRTIELLRSFDYNEFYTINRNKYGSNKIINFLIKSICGESSSLCGIDRLETKNYSFIIALPPS